MPSLILLNKPYGVLCQFSDSRGRPTLADFVPVPDVYPAGRLDADSEGLVVLTGDGELQHRITDPSHKLPKTYWVQVDGVPTRDALVTLRRGVLLTDGTTRPARVRRIDDPALWPRDPPIRLRQAIPTSWLELTLRDRRVNAKIALPGLFERRDIELNLLCRVHGTLSAALPGKGCHQSIVQHALHFALVSPDCGGDHSEKLADAREHRRRLKHLGRSRKSARLGE